MNEARQHSLAPVEPALAGPALAAPASSEPHAETDRFAKLPWGATWILLLALSSIIASVALIGVHARTGLFLYTLAILICHIAAVADAATRQVPYMLTYPAMLLGLLLNCFPVIFKLVHLEAGARWMGAVGPTQALLGFAVCASLGVIGVLFANVGGGDAKLLAALGALLGLSQVGAVVLVGLTIALVYAIINLAVDRRLNRVLQFASFRLLEVLYLRQFHYEPQEPEQGGLKGRIPMAVPLTIGLIAAPFLNINNLLMGGS